MGRSLAGVLLLVLSAATASAEVLWRGDFETGDPFARAKSGGLLSRKRLVGA
jgi:hypothetical protein